MFAFGNKGRLSYVDVLLLLLVVCVLKNVRLHLILRIQLRFGEHFDWRRHNSLQIVLHVVLMNICVELLLETVHFF